MSAYSNESSNAICGIVIGVSGVDELRQLKKIKNRTYSISPRKEAVSLYLYQKLVSYSLSSILSFFYN